MIIEILVGYTSLSLHLWSRLLHVFVGSFCFKVSSNPEILRLLHDSFTVFIEIRSQTLRYQGSQSKSEKKPVGVNEL